MNKERELKKTSPKSLLADKRLYVVVEVQDDESAGRNLNEIRKGALLR